MKATLYDISGEHRLGDVCRLRLLELGDESIGWMTECEQFGPRTLYVGSELVVDADARAVAVHDIGQNNAEFLILDGHWRRQAWAFRKMAHARFVGLRLDLSADFSIASAGFAKHLGQQRVRPVGVISCADDHRGTANFIVFEVVEHRPAKSARCFFSPELGTTGFLAQLDAAKIDHVVLRWFDRLVELGPREDVDLLVEDDGVHKIRDLLDNRVGIIPCDVYSPTGRDATGYRGVSYYPPALARRLVKGRRRNQHGVSIPAPDDYLASLAYHLVYHKGQYTRSDDRAAVSATADDHNYELELQRAARAAGYESSLVSIEEVESFVSDMGWTPPYDTIERLSRTNPWMQSHLCQSADQRLHDGLCVFIVRSRAVERCLVSKIETLIHRQGFYVLESSRIHRSRIERATAQIRGGNWARGSYSRSGGEPAWYIVAYDLLPQQPSSKQLREHPRLSNARILSKQTIREELNDGVDKIGHSNLLHSSDNGSQALTYLEIMCPHILPDVRAQVTSLHADFETTHPVVGNLTNRGCRAKVELVDYHGQLAVAKTFKPANERFLRRELLARTHWADVRPEIPPLIDQGANYIVMPFYKDQLGPRLERGRLMPLEWAHQAMELFQFLFAKNYTIVDAHPGNFLYSDREGLKLIDFEFLQRYDTPPASFTESFEIAGVSPGFGGDLPRGADTLGYEQSWRACIGLDYDDLRATRSHKPDITAHRKRAASAISRRVQQSWMYFKNTYKFRPHHRRAYLEDLDRTIESFLFG